jgi:hypothetical protein
MLALLGLQVSVVTARKRLAKYLRMETASLLLEFSYTGKNIYRQKKSIESDIHINVMGEIVCEKYVPFMNSNVFCM